MISFKQFLSEAVVKNWNIKDLEVKAAVNLLNKECKNGLNSIINGSVLYRGDSTGWSKSGSFVIDTSKASRTSKDTNNLYQLMMDTSSALNDFPSRSKSLICSTNKQDAENYGVCHIVVPFDRVSLAVSSRYDFIKSNVTIPLPGLQTITLGQLGRDFDDALAYLGIEPEGFQYKSAKMLDRELSKKSAELVFASLAWNIFNLSEISPVLNKTENSDLDSLDHPEILSALTAAFKDGTGSVSGDKLLKLLADNPKARFTALSNLIMTPDSLGLSLKKFGTALPENTEVWFSGKAVILACDLFRNILVELNKQGFHIHPEIIKQFNLVKTHENI